MRSRVAIVLALLAIAGTVHRNLEAHAGPRASDPADGATLGASPTFVRLSFSERPEVSLSTIRVLDAAGVAYHIGRPELVAADPFSISVRVKPLDRGVYIVSWRIVSAVDGHATAGSYAFGVLVAPDAAAAAAISTSPASRFEMAARWILIAGLVLMLGAATATLARFGGAGDFKIAAGGLLLAVLGLLLLTLAQRRNAAASFSDLLNTSVGRALLGRAAAIGVAGLALVAARSTRPRTARYGMAAAALATLAAIAVHVASGHAAADRTWFGVVAIAAQWAHFAASGIWLGGLAALLFAVRGAASETKAAAVRRFSTVAGAGLIAVIATGLYRTFGEIPAWGDLFSSGYGRAVVVKIALIAVIAALGAMNRWRSVPVAATDLGPLRRVGRGELALAAGALAAAAILGTLPPPASGLAAPLGLSASGSDFGTTARVQLTAASDQPGPNRFVVRALDYDSGQPVPANRVSLRFTPLDDPGVEPSTLILTRAADNSWEGSGANLAFDGRWQVTALVERDGDAVEAPMEIETRGPEQFVSIARRPGEPPAYTVMVAGAGHVRLSPDPERVGRNTLRITSYDVLSNLRHVEGVVVTIASGKERALQQAVTRVDHSTFVSEIDLQPGRNRIVSVVRATDGTRLRAAIEIDVAKK